MAKPKTFAEKEREKAGMQVGSEEVAATVQMDAVVLEVEQELPNVDEEERVEKAERLTLVQGYPESYKRRLARLDQVKRIWYGFVEGVSWRAREYPRFFASLWFYVVEMAGAFWRGCWWGDIFPFNIELHDFERGEGRAFGRHVAFGRFVAFLFVSWVMSIWLVWKFARRGGGVFSFVLKAVLIVALVILYPMWLDSLGFWGDVEESKTAAVIVKAGEDSGVFTAVSGWFVEWFSWVPIVIIGLFPLLFVYALGMWKTKRDFPGFRALLFGKLDETVERKKKTRGN
jgi:hypothetical protein